MDRRLLLLSLLLAAAALVFLGSTNLERGAGFASGRATTRGRRGYQEDRLLAISNLNNETNARIGVFAVFDGHIGSEASQFLVENLEAKLYSHLHEGLKKGAVRGRALSSSRHGYPAGSTACIALVTEKLVVVGNVGDSRAIVCGLGPDGNLQPRFTTWDHHPELPEEKARIEAAGGVVREGVINGHFPMSRAIGDLPLKSQGVIATPTITTLSRANINGYLVVASDGLYDGMEREEVCDIASTVERTNPKAGPMELAQAIADKALLRASKTSRDNISLIVVPLKQ